jgi:hypothetical protein
MIESGGQRRDAKICAVLPLPVCHQGVNALMANGEKEQAAARGDHLSSDIR